MTVLQTSFLLVFANTPNIRVPSRALLMQKMRSSIWMAYFFAHFCLPKHLIPTISYREDILHDMPKEKEIARYLFFS